MHRASTPPESASLRERLAFMNSSSASQADTVRKKRHAHERGAPDASASSAERRDKLRSALEAWDPALRGSPTRPRSAHSARSDRGAHDAREVSPGCARASVSPGRARSPAPADHRPDAPSGRSPNASPRRAGDQQHVGRAHGTGEFAGEDGREWGRPSETVGRARGGASSNGPASARQADLEEPEERDSLALAGTGRHSAAASHPFDRVLNRLHSARANMREHTDTNEVAAPARV